LGDRVDVGSQFVDGRLERYSQELRPLDTSGGNRERQPFGERSCFLGGLESLFVRLRRSLGCSVCCSSVASDPPFLVANCAFEILSSPDRSLFDGLGKKSVDIVVCETKPPHSGSEVGRSDNA